MAWCHRATVTSHACSHSHAQSQEKEAIVFVKREERFGCPCLFASGDNHDDDAGPASVSRVLNATNLDLVVKSVRYQISSGHQAYPNQRQRRRRRRLSEQEQEEYHTLFNNVESTVEKREEKKVCE
jgi:hypothetical protein